MALTAEGVLSSFIVYADGENWFCLPHWHVNKNCVHYKIAIYFDLENIDNK